MLAPPAAEVLELLVSSAEELPSDGLSEPLSLVVADGAAELLVVDPAPSAPVSDPQAVTPSETAAARAMRAVREVVMAPTMTARIADIQPDQPV